MVQLGCSALRTYYSTFCSYDTQSVIHQTQTLQAVTEGWNLHDSSSVWQWSMVRHPPRGGILSQDLRQRLCHVIKLVCHKAMDSCLKPFSHLCPLKRKMADLALLLVGVL